MTHRLIDLIVEDPGWIEALPDLEEVAETAGRMALEAAGLDPAGYEIALLACDDARIAALNSDFRGLDKPTNVLSWPAQALAPAEPGGRPPHPEMAGPGPVALGDVAIALQLVIREAESASLPLKNHAWHLILHGCLHLLGYDHVVPEDAALMEGLESRALMGAGLSDPYA